MSIKITNGATREVQVAVSFWYTDSDVSDTYYPLKPGDGEGWKRNDSRGYLMTIKGQSQAGVYYVAFDSEILIEDNRVKDRGETLTRLSLQAQ
ncbi:hypothetical protein KKQ10_04090 [Pseudomonas sp. MG-9]|uniref:Lipoprotein n=1 Tax=Pseudomonas serboccidentalis TaxID=2964670 RepID=A0ABY7Z6W4_9PSED|nr:MULTISPECIES: hypothetical protein [Pseudomonas]MBT9264040.1 hypothetical protein [Pseudomonas sp. MG-9]WDR35317.1 hypothetical protein NN484_22915 [Pseudomonas serboccidentalis]